VSSALLCILVQAAAIAHVDFAAHGVCREHGELTDLVVQPTVPGTKASLDPHPDGVAGLHVPASIVRAADEHCLLAEMIRQQDTARAILLPRRASTAWQKVPTEALRRATPPSWLLRFAPKQSPPA